LSQRKEVKGLFTFVASNDPQYELVVNNDVAMQKGVSIGTAMDNLSIVAGSTWEQGIIPFGQFFKVVVQALPEFRRYPEELDNMFVKNERGEMVPYSSFMTHKKMQGLNQINRYNLYRPLPLKVHRRRATVAVKPSGRSGRSLSRRCRTVTTSAGKAYLLTR
jgi:HAE1 family hydrophobic/amphiphilic exporter-1